MSSLLFIVHPAFASSLPISNFSYTYDNVGNRLSKVFNGGQSGENYSYDNLYQLTSVSNFQSHSYSYDPLGNRTLADGTSYTPNPLNQYTSVGGTSYTYNANGNLTNDGTYTYGYDYENRLTSVTGAGLNATYTYDPFGRRIEKQVNGVITRYLYDGDQVLAETNNTGTTTAKYTFGPGIDEPLAMQRNSKTYFFYQDGLGSTTEVVESGLTKESYTYDPYGKVTIKDLYGTVLPNSAIGNPYLFTGREFDSETGLYYYRARHYHPGIGRFLQRDPVGYTAGINLYTYVDNNPINWLDPMGWDKQKKDKPWWNWWAYESVVPGPYGQPMSEWGPRGPTEWGDPLKYTESVGGGWKWGERAAIGTATIAVITIIAAPLAREAFHRGGWLNSNPYIRIGWSWKGTARAGKEVFRIAIGNRNAPIWWHIDLWPF